MTEAITLELALKQLVDEGWDRTRRNLATFRLLELMKIDADEIVLFGEQHIPRWKLYRPAVDTYLKLAGAEVAA